jgi:transposase-like protein
VRRGIDHKHKVLALIDRNTRRSRAFVVDNLQVETLAPIVRENVAKEATLMTDESGAYKIIGRRWFDGHKFVRHGKGEYVSREDRSVHTNTLEGYFSIFKPGMKGIYQHCGKKHLHRYVAEFNFRCSNRVALGINDQARADHALRGIVGKRLTYRMTGV